MFANIFVVNSSLSVTHLIGHIALGFAFEFRRYREDVEHEINELIQPAVKKKKELLQSSTSQFEFGSKLWAEVTFHVFMYIFKDVMCCIHLEISNKFYTFKSSSIYTEQVSYILEKSYTVKPPFSAPPIKWTETLD